MDKVCLRLEVNTGPTFLEFFNQHQAGSHLLEQQHLNETTKASRPQVFSGYDDDDDDDDTRPLSEDSVHSEREDAELSSTSVYWKGPPVYTLTWDILSILLSTCFLGMTYR